jgi:excisionase family DNA binding protein
MPGLTYTVPELAEALGIGERHLRRLAKEGVIPTLAIEAWLARSAA